MSAEVLYRRVYFIRGAQPKGSMYRYAVKNPPTAGWHGVIVLPGPKWSTLFCMFTFWSQQVPNQCEEMHRAKVVDVPPERIVAEIQQSWQQHASIGSKVDYDTAAIILTRLGQPVPTIQRVVKKDDDEPTTRHGKPLVESALSPVKRGSKRGAVLAFFLDTESHTRPIREAMAVMGASRSGILSHLHTLNKYHGIGYDLAGDVVHVLIPADWDAFAVTPAETTATVTETRVKTPRVERPSGKPIRLDALRPISRPSRRAAVVESLLEDSSIDKAAEKCELTRSAVLSHLFSMNKDNGIGYEIDAARQHVKLLVPSDHQLFIDKE